MCRFLRNGQPEIGVYLQSDDGIGSCRMSNLSDEDKTIIVSYPDGTMPSDISDLELFEVPFFVGYDSDATYGDHIPLEVRERMSKTNLILEEYEAGVLDEQEAGEALFNHLFGKDRYRKEQ